MKFFFYSILLFLSTFSFSQLPDVLRSEYFQIEGGISGFDYTKRTCAKLSPHQAALFLMADENRAVLIIDSSNVYEYRIFADNRKDMSPFLRTRTISLYGGKDDLKGEWTIHIMSSGETTLISLNNIPHNQQEAPKKWKKWRTWTFFSWKHLPPANINGG